MTAHKVTSEILCEKDVRAAGTLARGGNSVSSFAFKYPVYLRKGKQPVKGRLEVDEDGDLILDRQPDKGCILIEHSNATELKLVGLQIWRGALLLADYILSRPEIFQDKTVLELGSGVGFDSIIASMLAKEVICTDVNIGGILKLIENNFQRNKQLVKSSVCVTELNFLDPKWNATLKRKVAGVNVIMAADVIYDDKITEGFVKTLSKLLDSTSDCCEVYVALEKRYVFTIADLDSVAPMYEEFLRCIARLKLDWTIHEVELDFPQYFQYDRVRQMILMKIQKKS